VEPAFPGRRPIVGAAVLAVVGWGWPHLQSRSGRVRVSGEARLLMWRPGAPAFWVGLWGRASRLPISPAAGGVACPRASGALGKAGTVRVRWRPGAPAFWFAAAGSAGVPASPHRRGRAGDDWRAATAPMGRRRPASWIEQPHRSGVPRGEPGIGIVRGVKATGRASQAQCRARHAPKSARSPRAQTRDAGCCRCRCRCR